MWLCCAFPGSPRPKMVEFMEGRECSLHGCDVDASGFMTGFMNVGLGSDTN